MRQGLLSLACAGALVLSLGGCGKEEAVASGPLAYVPADTPYVFANLEPISEQRAQEWLGMLAELPRLYVLQLQQVRTALTRSGEADAVLLGALDGLQAEIEGKSFEQILQGFGYSMQTRIAVYGLDLVPVMRAELADPSATRAAIARIEAKAGQPLPTGKLGDLSYWQLAPKDAPLMGVMAIIDNHLVLSIAPAKADEALLKQIFGMTPPAESMLVSEGLSKLNAQYGYLPFGSGYFDLQRAWQLVAQPTTPLQAAFMQSLEVTPPALDAACTQEMDALAKAWPRSSFGYTRLDPGVVDMRWVTEAPAAVLSDLRTLRAPTPGLAAADEALFNMSFALKLDALPPLANKWADAVAATPWQCEFLQPMNQAFADARSAAANPGIYAVAPVMQSINVLLTHFKPAPDMAQPEFKGKLLIGSPSPAALVSMLKAYVPGMATLEVPVDGSATALPAIPEMPIALPMFAAQTGNVFGIAVGEGEDAALGAAMQMDSATQPLMTMAYDGALYGELLGMMEPMLLAMGDTPEAKESAEMLKISRELYAKMFGRLAMRVEVTEQGIELIQRMEMPKAP